MHFQIEVKHVHSAFLKKSTSIGMFLLEDQGFDRLVRQRTQLQLSFFEKTKRCFFV